MARLIIFAPSKTYATRENAVKAVNKKCGPSVTTGKANDNLDYFIMTHTDGRFFPVFVGERALQKGVHFHFNVIN